MDIRYVKPFLSAVQCVFETMVQAKALVGRPYLKDGMEREPEVAAVIGLSGGATGSVILCFPQLTAEKVASQFSGMDLTIEHEDFSDALGELVNMVAGQAKSQLAGLKASISLPQVVIGQVLGSKKTPTLVLPCDSELGKFRLEISLVFENKTDTVAV